MLDRHIFTVEFHTPFRVGTQRVSRTQYGAQDEAIAAPGSAIKGMMRDAATDLDLPHHLIREVFGSEADKDNSDTEPDSSIPTSVTRPGPAIPSPWGWSDLHAESIESATRTRIAIDASTGTSSPGALVTVREYFATSGSFSIERIGHLTAIQREKHSLVLEATATLMSAFGADRRRGLGWISCVRTAPPSRISNALNGSERERSDYLNLFTQSILDLRNENDGTL